MFYKRALQFEKQDNMGNKLIQTDVISKVQDADNNNYA